MIRLHSFLSQGDLKLLSWKRFWFWTHQNFEEGVLVLGGRLAALSSPALVVNIMPCFSSQRSAEVFFSLSVCLGQFRQFSATGHWACPVQGTVEGWAEQSACGCDYSGAGNSLLPLCCSCCASLRAGFLLGNIPKQGFLMVGVYNCLRQRGVVGSFARKLRFSGDRILLQALLAVSVRAPSHQQEFKCLAHRETFILIPTFDVLNWIMPAGLNRICSQEETLIQLWAGSWARKPVRGVLWKLLTTACSHPVFVA